jgi:hypothetical protein
MSATEYLAAHHATQADACRSLRANTTSANLRAAYTREATAHEALSLAYADLANAEEATHRAERADRLTRQSETAK